jgi:7-cyano-7-deazaguanine synthase
MQPVKAIVLLSGGIDSCVILAMLRQRRPGEECLALSFSYGQRHSIELKSAKAIANHYGVQQQTIEIDPASFKGSSLMDQTLVVPKGRSAKLVEQEGIPSTYVPARNTLFLAYAMCHAEIHQAEEIHFGPNAVDQHPYPDCRPNYMSAFQGLLNCATKQAVEGNPPLLVTPLLTMTKNEIIATGLALKAPLELTFTCYDPTPEGNPCRHCDACLMRRDAFLANGCAE